MLTLAIDTAANFCSACLFDEAAGRMLAEEERDIGRGHAEQLLQVIETVMHASGRDYSDLGRIAVAVGPGSFTGIRVGVAAARGFGLALSIPVAGVTTLEALSADAAALATGPHTVATKGGRGQVFMQHFNAEGTPTGEAVAIGESEAAGAVPAETDFLAGNAAPAIAGALAETGRELPVLLDRATGAIATIARLASISAHSPVPLYLRGADAKPQEGFALPRAETSGGDPR